MAQEVIYADGHGIKVTPQQFIVGKTEYLMKGITNIRLHTIKANLAPAIILIILGIAATVAGFMRLFRVDSSLDGVMGTTSYGPNEIAMIVGGVLFLLGLVWALISNERYAVRVTTAEGEKNAVVSTKKDYISQIVHAVNNALRFPFQRESGRGPTMA
jgi:hypothetical protein